MNNKGNLMQLPVNLLMLFITFTFLVTLIPGFAEMQGMAQNNDNLNCKGYVDYDDASLSYNSSQAEVSSMACLAIKMYLPYIVLGVLIAGVAIIFYGRGEQQQPGY